jgi:hypothetical protein
MDTMVGAEEMPVALLPIVNDDIDGVRLMQQSGVDYTKLSYHGVTALEFARQNGRADLLDVLGHERAVL